jgi:hypothetical protein
LGVIANPWVITNDDPVDIVADPLACVLNPAFESMMRFVVLLKQVVTDLNAFPVTV